MNAFADTLLSLMFGWLRTLVEGIWSTTTSGRFQHMLVWLGDHWFFVALGLCILFTVVDFLVWLIRWQPYRLWHSRIARLLGRAPRERREFRHGYDSGVEMDFSDLAPATPAEDYAAWQPETWQPAPQEEDFPLFTSPAPGQPSEEDAYGYSQPATVRNRRSERYEKKKFRIGRILAPAKEEEAAMLDGLPPAVDKENAFHAPVYPNQSPKQ